MFVVLADYTFKRSARTRLCQAGDAQTLGSKDRAGRSRNMQEEPRRNTPFFTTLQTTRMVQGECEYLIDFFTVPFITSSRTSVLSPQNHQISPTPASNPTQQP